MFARIVKVAMVVAVLSTVSGCFPFWGPGGHGGGGGGGGHHDGGGQGGPGFGGPGGRP
ncbi:MAG TPA: hypothetical protein VF682_02815 [Pseudomonas sp.]|uniref:hypothetical protein n=1 Tax=Pseudomonas sp. G.S.17 TaxID=3137451 RepID=UPI002EFD68EC